MCVASPPPHHQLLHQTNKLRLLLLQSHLSIKTTFLSPPDEINRQGITVLLIEQNANMALKVADWAYVMQTGSILMRGPGAELAANEEVKAAYLGTAK